MTTVVLGVDTAGPVISAALLLEGGAGEVWSERIVRGADGVLVPAIQRLLAVARGRHLRVTRVAVSVGPGGFTGLRVGVASALGVAVGLGVPVVAVSSLQARAALVPNESNVLAMLDARKSRVYAGGFDSTVWPPSPLGPERDVEPDLAWPASPFIAVGEGALVYCNEVVAAGGTIHPDAGEPCALAVAMLGAMGTPVSPDELRLRYIRPPDAQVPASLRGVFPKPKKES